MLLRIVFSILVFNSAQGAELTLTEQLKQKADESASKSPDEVKKTMMAALEDLRKSKIAEKALKKGDSIPSFELPDVKKGLVSSKELLEKGPLIIVFYRGGWCPYCNLQLRDLQKSISEINDLGGQLVAISPEAPDNARETVKKQGLGYYVLSDVKADVGKKFGLMFTLPEDLIELYKKFGIDLNKANASQKWELPLAATYIVNKDGKITYSFVDVDYKKRAETKDLIAVLKKIQANTN